MGSAGKWDRTLKSREAGKTRVCGVYTVPAVQLDRTKKEMRVGAAKD